MVWNCASGWRQVARETSKSYRGKLLKLFHELCSTQAVNPSAAQATDWIEFEIYLRGLRLLFSLQIRFFLFYFEKADAFIADVSKRKTMQSSLIRFEKATQWWDSLRLKERRGNVLCSIVECCNTASSRS